MSEWWDPQRWVELATQLWIWIQANLLGRAAAAQISTIVVAFVLALLIAKRFEPWLRKQTAHPVMGTFIRIVLPALMPMLWLVLLWIALAIADSMAWGTGWISSVAGLLVAWVAIRLVSQLVRNPVWSNVLVWTAWTIAALNILGWLEPTIAYLEQQTVLGSEITLLAVVQAVILLVILLSGAIYLTSLLEVRIRTSRALSPSLQVLFIKSLKFLLIALAVLVPIDQIGIDLTALAVFGGALGVGVGFGLQRVVSNLISGVILLVDKSIKPGDVIAVAGTYGWVTALGGRYVSVVTRDGVEHLIPNELLISERVENWTHTHSRTRLKVNVGVHYKTDLHQAIAICLDACRETERVLSDPEPKCLLIEFGDSSVNLQIRFWIADAHNGVQNVSSEVLLKVWDKFQANGVEIPYPQRDLHLRSGFEQLRGAVSGSPD
jgi:small-conductance mechanosensitive channel